MTIAEEALQKMYKNLGNRLLFVLRQDGEDLKHLLNY